MKLTYVLLLYSLTFISYAKEISFDKDIRPILSNKCYACHGFDEENRDAGLRLDTFKGATGDLGGYAAIVPGKAHLSELIKRVETDDEDDIMPPEGERLTKEQIATLKAWINQGAKYEKLWSYKELIKPTIPSIKSASVKNPIDNFVLQKLKEQNKSLSRQEDPAILIRRASLDLTGLPPKLDDVLAFEENPSDKAYERYIDKLLNSQAFGERWAVHWLDQARYGDSNGYQHDQRRTVWLYRDWVINALNSNMPFDQFATEQIAGDLLPNSTRDQKIATGFNRCGPVNIGGGSKVEETKYDLAKDRVNTVGTIFLGATLDCAQCHNHKFDPITQKDYYRLLSYFYSSEDRVVSLSKNSMVKRVFGGELILDSFPKDKNHEKFVKELIDHGTKTVAANKIAILIKQGIHKADNAQELINKADKMQDKSIAMVKTLDSTADHRMLIMKESEKPKQAHVLKLGNYLKKMDPVTPGTPGSLHPLKKHEKSTRLELAEWITSKENPLTPRVIVNRYWEQMFGRGIVTTTEDFGYQGEAPSHPKLLDWLAADFRSHWSIKKTLKTIAMSATYRQSSNQVGDFDPQNILLSRGPSKRLHAEFIRDNVLAVSGLLNRKMGGAPVFPVQPDKFWKQILGNKDKVYPLSSEEEGLRRSIYMIWRRGAIHPIFSTFDAQPRNISVSHRSMTNTPLQALVVMNEPVFLKAAEFLGKRIQSRSGSDTDKIKWAFRHTLAREASEHEINILNKLKSESESDNQGWFFLAHTLLNLDEVIRSR